MCKWKVFSPERINMCVQRLPAVVKVEGWGSKVQCILLDQSSYKVGDN